MTRITSERLWRGVTIREGAIITLKTGSRFKVKKVTKSKVYVKRIHKGKEYGDRVYFTRGESFHSNIKSIVH